MKENSEQLRSAEEMHELKGQINEVLNDLRYGFTDWDEAADRLFRNTSQFKSQLPIEQKNELELIIAEKNIDIIHLRDRIKELESQPSPIEGVEREQLREAFEAGQHADEYDQWVKHNYDKWLATRKGSKSGE